MLAAIVLASIFSKSTNAPDTYSREETPKYKAENPVILYAARWKWPGEFMRCTIRSRRARP